MTKTIAFNQRLPNYNRELNLKKITITQVKHVLNTDDHDGHVVFFSWIHDCSPLKQCLEDLPWMLCFWRMGLLQCLINLFHIFHYCKSDYCFNDTYVALVFWLGITWNGKIAIYHLKTVRLPYNISLDSVLQVWSLRLCKSCAALYVQIATVSSFNCVPVTPLHPLKNRQS